MRATLSKLAQMVDGVLVGNGEIMVTSAAPVHLADSDSITLGYSTNPMGFLFKLLSKLGVPEESVKLNATFIDDLSADSLDIVELVMAIEEEFGISIPDSDAEVIVTVEDVVKYIKNVK